MTLLNLITKEDLEQFKTELFAELKHMPSSNLDSNLKQPWLKSVEVVYIGDSGPSVSLEDGPVVSVILGQQL